MARWEERYLTDGSVIMIDTEWNCRVEGEEPKAGVGVCLSCGHLLNSVTGCCTAADCSAPKTLDDYYRAIAIPLDPVEDRELYYWHLPVLQPTQDYGITEQI